ncbi:MAG: DUF4890 domain-containing protein [Prevotella sp.]|nr:DUF4890 domain-containing protein [Prevotella sp.]
MKKIILTMVALLSMTTMMAQNDEQSERKAPKQLTPEEMTEKMTKDLSLTDEQKTKVLALNKEYQDIHKAHRGPRMGGPRSEGKKADGETGATEQKQRPERPQFTEEQRAEMQKQMERRREFDTKLKEILNANQYEKYQKQHSHGRRGPGGPRGPHMGGPRMM